MTFVQKTCAFNVDEIDTSSQFHLQFIIRFVTVPFAKKVLTTILSEQKSCPKHIYSKMLLKKCWLNWHLKYLSRCCWVWPRCNVAWPMGAWGTICTTGELNAGWLLLWCWWWSTNRLLPYSGIDLRAEKKIENLNELFFFLLGR